jgi:succinoglycan biosynthesis protein ExoM
LLHGKPFVFCTCNFLIDLGAIRAAPRPLFDPAFGLSGGGDVVFFRGLFFDGHPMAWAESALVYEEVPPSRASLQWMRTRRFRVGNHAGTWETRDRGRLRATLKTIALTVRLAIYPLLMREPEARGVGWLLEMDKVRGRWDAHRGSLFVEYGRSEVPANGKACR